MMLRVLRTGRYDRLPRLVWCEGYHDVTVKALRSRGAGDAARKIKTQCESCLLVTQSFGALTLGKKNDKAFSTGHRVTRFRTVR